MSERVKELVAQVLGLPSKVVTDELAMSDVATWDSLKHMELVVALERAFDLSLSFDEIVSLRSVRDIERVLTRRAANG